MRSCPSGVLLEGVDGLVGNGADLGEALPAGHGEARRRRRRRRGRRSGTPIRRPRPRRGPTPPADVSRIRARSAATRPPPSIPAALPALPASSRISTRASSISDRTSWLRSFVSELNSSPSDASSPRVAGVAVRSAVEVAGVVAAHGETAATRRWRPRRASAPASCRPRARRARRRCPRLGAEAAQLGRPLLLVDRRPGTPGVRGSAVVGPPAAPWLDAAIPPAVVPGDPAAGSSLPRRGRCPTAGRTPDGSASALAPRKSRPAAKPAPAAAARNSPGRRRAKLWTSSTTPSRPRSCSRPATPPSRSPEVAGVALEVARLLGVPVGEGPQAAGELIDGTGGPGACRRTPAGGGPTSGLVGQGTRLGPGLGHDGGRLAADVARDALRLVPGGRGDVGRPVLRRAIVGDRLVCHGGTSSVAAASSTQAAVVKPRPPRILRQVSDHRSPVAAPA